VGAMQFWADLAIAFSDRNFGQCPMQALLEKSIDDV